jgi:GT2 family glycosyltransferase
MNLSIVVVTWNAKKYVWECLSSLLKLKELCSSEIIVIDNDSSDGTPELVRDSFPLVKLVRNDSNLGFAKATNIGIKEASGKYVCLINSDVVVPEGCIESMFRYMEQNQDIGLLGPQMLGPDGLVHRSTMRFPTVWSSFCHALALDSLFKGSKFFGGFLMRDFEHDKTMDVDVLNGWFWMVRRTALDQVGLLDERFFIYGEDIDWCRRFYLADWRVVLYHAAAALHYGGASSARAPIRFYIEMQRANLQYWKKHSSRLAIWCFVFNSWIHHIIRIVGHGTICMFSRSRCSEAAFKVERSVASIRWLIGHESGSLKER